jgi:hypothetical protein
MFIVKQRGIEEDNEKCNWAPIEGATETNIQLMKQNLYSW